jgi:predicted CopG family antitoxin
MLYTDTDIMKTIMITDDVYRRLSSVKGKMSFSELFDSILKEQRSTRLAAFEKIRGILTAKEAKEAYRKIGELNKNAVVRTFETAP